MIALVALLLLSQPSTSIPVPMDVVEEEDRVAQLVFMLPDRELTPGSVNATLSATDLCAPEFFAENYRHVSASLKKRVFQEYGIHCSPLTTGQNQRDLRFRYSCESGDLASTELLFEREHLGYSGLRDSPLRFHAANASIPSRTDRAASAAPTSTVFDDVGVLRREFMAVDAMRPRGLCCQRTTPTQYVFTMANWFQMRWLDTTGVPAQMVQFVSSGDWSYQKLISKSMGADAFGGSVKDAAISTRFKNRASPEPTVRGGIFNDVSPERFVEALPAPAPSHNTTHDKSTAPPCKDWEIDHLVSLELGGTNDIRNLWPQPIAEAREKDRIENRLRHLVCEEKIPLSEAQHCLATNWTECP